MVDAAKVVGDKIRMADWQAYSRVYSREYSRTYSRASEVASKATTEGDNG